MTTKAEIPTARSFDANPYMRLAGLRIEFSFDGMSERGEVEFGAAKALALQHVKWIPVFGDEEHETEFHWVVEDIDWGPGDTDVTVWLNREMKD